MGTFGEHLKSWVKVYYKHEYCMGLSRTPVPQVHGNANPFLGSVPEKSWFSLVQIWMFISSLHLVKTRVHRNSQLQLSPPGWQPPKCVSFQRPAIEVSLPASFSFVLYIINSLNLWVVIGVYLLECMAYQIPVSLYMCLLFFSLLHIWSQVNTKAVQIMPETH